MESALSRGCTLKLQNFEGPFDLLFHLIEKNKINIYDIPINEITDQYMEYLFAMRELDMEIASEFLVMAATLLHIKSRMLLPNENKTEEEEKDPREELILRLIEYKKYKETTSELKEKEKIWSATYYKLPEFVDVRHEPENLDISPGILVSIYSGLLRQNKQKMNGNANRINTILKKEQVTLRSKIREIINIVRKKSSFIFSEIFSLGKRSKIEVVVGFLAILELAKLRRLKLEQKKTFSDIVVSRNEEVGNEGEPVAGVADGY